MSLYDQYQQAQTPYMSQFVGSIVPEVGQFVTTMSQRYNDAADQDDMLSEALGNLHHLNFDGDTQYANELKDHYYQRLQDRSARGDFENMGRRTRMDAMRFAQAYQPLVQRQQDMGELVKKISNDQNVADPAIKQALIQKAMMQSAPQKNPDGTYTRDQNGRILLPGVQDMPYAPDADVSKILMDTLSKMEANVAQGNYEPDGKGGLISTKEEVRDPANVARVAKMLMSSDPRIKAMIDRDTDLKTYNLSPTDVHQQLLDNGMAQSPYHYYKSQGLNAHEIAAHLQKDGIDINTAKQSQLDIAKARMMSSGMSEQAAEKAILNNHVKGQIMQPYMETMADVLGFKKQTLDRQRDMGWEIGQSAEANKAPNVIPIQGTSSVTSQEDPVAFAKAHAQSVQDMQTNAQSVQSAILSGMKATGMSTGNAKQDMTQAIAMMHNPVKLNVLKMQLAKTNPVAAQTLESVASDYTNRAALIESQSNHLGDIEKAGGVDWDKAYQEYVKDKSGRSISNIFDATIKSKPDFINAVRSGHLVTPNDFSLEGPVGKYKDALSKGMKAVNDGLSQGAGYTTLEPTGPGKANSLTDALNNLVLTNNVKGIDLNGSDSTPVDVAQAMGIKPGSKDAAKQMKELQVRFNTESINGKPTITATLNGVTKKFQAQNLPAGIQDELNVELLKNGSQASTTEYGKTQMKQALIGMGSSTWTDNTPQYLKTVNPGASGVIKKLNDRFSVRVRDAGAGLRKYQLYYNNADGSTVPTSLNFDSVDDLAAATGQEHYKNITNGAIQRQLNTQRK